MTPIQKALIDAGVKNLREFGYPNCNADNILTDGVYRAFFKSMLESNRGKDSRVDAAIAELLPMVEEPESVGAVARGRRKRQSRPRA